MCRSIKLLEVSHTDSSGATGREAQHETFCCDAVKVPLTSDTFDATLCIGITAAVRLCVFQLMPPRSHRILHTHPLCARLTFDGYVCSNRWLRSGVFLCIHCTVSAHIPSADII
jgi:hypothetical protein